MGDRKLCLVLLLGAIALAQADEDATCLMSKRYKPFHKYEFLYEAESLNFLNGAVNGPKGTCKVEIEVPGPCNYIVRTTECTLSEVTDFDATGNPIFAPAATSDAFRAAMEKHALKVTVEGDDTIKLFPEDDEPINILNIKRGIISGFAVPVMEEEKNKDMPTIYGLCKTTYAVNSREDIATDVTLTRDLSRCDRFKPTSDHRSPLALITGMNYPISKLIKSTQTCNYKFDNAGHHPVFGECTENHILVPFSHKGKNGVTNVSKQKATLLAVSEYNDRVFDPILANEQTLHPHASVDKSPIQDKDAALALLRELAGLSKTENGQKRAHLAHQIVSMIRKMSVETLDAGVPEAMEISRPLTYQALFQCGTPECSSAIMKIFRTFDSSSMEIDAAVYAMGMLPNPSRQLVSDMLEMAKFKQSKPIFYGASNAVKRLYKAEGKVTPEIEAVANFALEQIGDCTGDQEHIFMSLKVIGNMAAAMGAASPALKSAVVQCVNQPAATPEVQLAAIQAFRQTTLPEEGRQILMQVLLDGAAPLQKRVAAYLILMKDPQPSELSQLAAALPVEENEQAKSFVISHLHSILTSTAPDIQELRQKILDALQGNDIGKPMDPARFSRFYQLSAMKGNVIFEGSSYLPREVMMDLTLRAFDFDFDTIEFGIEGTGLEPTVEALFGPNGFFPDTVLATMYFAADKMPGQFGETLKNMLPSLRNDRKKRQSSQKLLRDIGRNVNKLIRDLKAQDAPEAMVYMRLLGMELGYLKTKDMEEMAYSAAMVIDNLMKMFPTDFIKDLLTSADNELFAHYIFMDNEFYLPTGPGVPLRVALSGTFTPGVKGGIHLSADMSEVAFMPSAGVEFVTEVGAHFPDFVQSGLAMHTNIYHESGMKAKVSVSHNNIKLTVPAPQSPTKIFSLTNTLVSVHGAETKAIPSKGERVDVAECTPVFAGMKYCTALEYSDAMHHDDAPYFPFTGDSKLAIELHPTGEVSEYVGNIDYSYEDHTDKVTLTLKSEGAASAEAKAIVQFNRQKYTIAADLEIPDYDLEVGLRFGSVDPNTKGKASHGVQIDFVNKNIPQASLVALAKIAAMKDATLDLQLLVPVLQVDAKASAHIHRSEDLTLELETDIKLPATSSVQKIVLKYDADKLEAKIKSDLNSEYQKIIPQLYHIRAGANAALDLKIGETDLSVRDVLSKSVQTTNAYLDKLQIPYLQNVRLPSLPEITLPETLYMNAEADAKYHFGQHYYTISIPLPHGGKSTGDLNFPAALTTPHLTVPQLGLELASMNIPIPEVFVPEHLSVSVPVLGKAEASAKVHSNIYNLEGEVSAGRDPVDHPSYSAKMELTGSCPVDLFCFKAEAMGLLAGVPGDSLKAELKTHFNNKFIDTSLSIEEVATINEKFSLKSNNKIEANSPLGMHMSLAYDGVAALNTEEISGYGNLNADIKTGPVYGGITISQNVEVFPFKPEAKIDSTLKIDSTFIKAQNAFATAFANGELTATSNTAALDDALVHLAEVTFKESTLGMKSDAKVEVLGLKIQNVAEASAGAGVVTIKMATNADHPDNHIHSTVSATLDVTGLAINSDADIKLAENTATHKASLTLNKEGLNTNGATSLQSPLKLENTFSGSIEASKFAFNIDNKGNFAEMRVSNTMSLSGTPSTVAFNTNAEVFVTEGTSYIYSIVLDVHDFTASMNINNDLKVLHANLLSEAMLKAEPYKADLTGTVKASYGEEELKHTFEIKYADLIANAKCSTTGKLMGSHLSQNTEVEVAGLTVRMTNDARFNCQLLRYDNTIRATAVPFSFTVDAIANADGDLTLYGKHKAQVYTKYLMKVEPLAFAHSHECRLSTYQNLDNGITAETVLDNKIETLLTPSEQKAHVTLKSKFNNHAMNEEFNVYNNPERLGVEVAGTILTPLLNTADSDNHEFSMSAFLKYDKSTSSHIINLPFVESFPVLLEHVKTTIVAMAETLQGFISREDILNKIESIPQHISDFVKEMNVEERAVQLKQDLLSLTREYAITIEDLEAALTNLKSTVERILSDLATRAHDGISMITEVIKNGILSEDVYKRLTDELNALGEEYDINSMLVAIIETIEEVIKHIDLVKLKDSSIAFLHDLDAQYAIKATLEEKLGELKQIISNFSLANFVEDVKAMFASVDIQGLTNQVVAQIPTEEIKKIIDAVKTFVTEMDIIGKLNAGYGHVKALLVKYELDKSMETLLEKIVELIQKFKINETVQVVADTLKSIHIPVTQTLEAAINYLKATDIKEVINHLNEYIDAFVHQMKAFDYNAFVDHANEKIAAYTGELNTLIGSLEIPQKFEAVRDFFNFALSRMTTLWEELRSIKIADAVKSVRDIIVIDIDTMIQSVKASLQEIDLREVIHHYLQTVSNLYTKAMDIIVETFSGITDAVQTFAADHAIYGQLKQMVGGVVAALKTAELDFPSFNVPFTTLTVPSFKVSLANLQDSLPSQIDLPEFTILGFHTVPAMTITYDDVKQKVMQLIDFIVSFDFTFMNAETFFGDLTLNYLPDISSITLPEITLPEMSLPAIPKYSADHLIDIPLQIPEIKLPNIPSELTVPAFGKLYGEFKVNTPMYSLRSAGQFENAAESDTTPQYTASLTSQGSSSIFETLNYNLDISGQVKFPEMRHIVIVDTLKFTTSILAVDHEATMTIDEHPIKGSAKTTVKATTAPFTAELVSNIVINGLSLDMDATYNHHINIPLISFTSEMSLTHKVGSNLQGKIFTITLADQGSIKFALPDYSDEGTIKADFQYTTDRSTFKMVYTGDINSNTLKMKQVGNVDGVYFSNVKVEGRTETESPFIKSSVVTGYFIANFPHDIIELKINHDTELTGILSGTISNYIYIWMVDLEMDIEFQNKANAKASVGEILSAKVDVQSDHTAVFRWVKQRVNSMTMVKLNQHKIGYNATYQKDNEEIGLYAEFDSQANFDFLTVPISIPEITVPFINLKTPAITDLNIYEHSGLNHILTSTEQTIDFDAKLVYTRSQHVPILHLGIIRITPEFGGLQTEMSFKSSIFNLNVNTEVTAEDDLVIRFGAISASVFESLKAKFDGTSSLSTKRGMKLATALSLENAHIEATHDCNLNLNGEEIDASLSSATVAKVNLPILTAEFNHQMKADHEERPKATSTLKIKYNLNVPLIKAVGAGDAENILKFESNFGFISADSVTKGQIDGTILDTGLVKGALDHSATIYVDRSGLRSTMKAVGNGHVSYGDLKVELDMDEDIALEASPSRIYSTAKINSNNDINIAALNTKGKHAVKATIDVTPLSTLADIEFDLAQPSTFGEMSFYDKTVIELTNQKQKIAYNAKMVSPVDTVTVVADIEGGFPNMKIIFKLSSTSPIEFLVYDLDSSITSAVENSDLSLTGKAVFTHAEATVDIQNILTAGMSDDGTFRHSLNVDVSSPSFTDVNFRYAARKDGASASISTPSTGFLGLQLQGRVPSQLYARLYSRYTSAPENDVEILTIKAVAKDGDKLRLQVSYNLDAPRDMISGLEERVPAITSTLVSFADKYGFASAFETMKNVLVNTITEAYNTAKSHSPEMSQLSILFRDVVVQYQKTIQTLIDATIKFLRETHIELPGMEKATLPEIVHKITTNVGTVAKQLLMAISENLQVYLTPLLDTISSLQLTLPSGEVLTGGQIMDHIKAVLLKVSEMVKNLETLDQILEKLSQTFHDVVERSQTFVDNLHSDILNTISMYFNIVYHNLLAVVKTVTDHVDSLLNLQEVNDTLKHTMEFIRSVIQSVSNHVSALLPNVDNSFLRVSSGNLELELPFSIQQ